MPDTRAGKDEPQGPTDSSLTPRFAGLATFARLPELRDVGFADVAVVGAPFDAGVSYRSGARFGPAHIREASRLLRPYNPAVDVHPFRAQQVADAGDMSINPFDITAAVAEIERSARALGAHSGRLLVLGGDHTIALPLLRVVAERHGPVAVVHFDAHLDTWDTYFGAPITHGTPFRRASEEGLIDRGASLHVGTRGPLYGDEDLQDDTRLGFAVIRSDDLQSQGLAHCIERMHARLGDRPVYVSVDIDVLDPAHAPGTGTPRGGRDDQQGAVGDAPRTRGTPPGRGGRRRGLPSLRPRTNHRRRRQPCGVRNHLRDGAERKEEQG